MDIFKELQEEGVDAALLEEIRRFRQAHPAPVEAAERVPQPRYLYYGREIWESAAAALLCGEHLLLAGPKATGKNVLAENLAAVFGRPVWDVSMYVNVDAAALIGADTLRDGQVEFREGPVSKCARLGGFGVLDEVNMAKNDARAVLHATLDHRRVIDVPGYERIHLDEATRFIELRLRRDEGAQRGAGVPICGGGYAHHLRREPEKAPAPQLPHPEGEVGGAVHGPVPGSAAEVRQR